MAELTVVGGRPMTHDLRSMCDAVAYVVKTGIEWRALPVDFPCLEGGVRVLGAVEQPRPAAGADPSAPGTAARASGPRGAAVGMHRGLPRSSGPRHGLQENQRLPQREEDHREGPAPGHRLRGLAAGPSGHRRLGQRQGRRETTAHPPARRVQHAEDHVGRFRVRRHPAGPLRQDCRRDHRGGRQADRPAFLPGPAPQAGHRAHLRLADALPLRCPSQPGQLGLDDLGAGVVLAIQDRHGLFPRFTGSHDVPGDLEGVSQPVQDFRGVLPVAQFAHQL